MPAPTAAPAQPTGNDTMEKLDSLKKMLENGLITQEEFDAKRKELLEKL
ncbi:MAG: SHOCT domain-containing protein [Ruminococcus sp.]|nr:SHOCT domain-containing protein [Ruminococcus sp.]